MNQEQISESQSKTLVEMTSAYFKEKDRAGRIHDKYGDALEKIDELTAENGRLREALRPFADAYNRAMFPPLLSGYQPNPGHFVNVEEWQAAALALEMEQPE
jgi:hypothetical protein